MSDLPQRRKSAEEIAKLRESLGIGGPPPVEETIESAPVAPVPEPVETAPLLQAAPVPEEPVWKAAPVVDAPPEPSIQPLPVVLGEPKLVRSLKRSERIPVLPIEESGPPPGHSHEAGTLPPLHAGRTVRSLRKSEQGPLPPAPGPVADSKLPHHRHSDRELNEIRRHEALAQLGQHAPRPLAAHLALIIPGYISAAAGAAVFLWYDMMKHLLWLTASCAGLALLIAAVIFFRRPLSRHHAAFIAVIALFVTVFGALYYFPQLSYGTFPQPSQAPAEPMPH